MAGSGSKVVTQAIVGNFIITVMKFFGFFISASPSMLAEAIHSLADTFNQLLLLIGLKQSSKLASREYSTGQGGARYVWNLISAVGVFFIGFGVTFYHGMHSLLDEDFELGEISYLSIGILIAAFVIEFWVFLQALKEVNRQRKKLSLLQFFNESDDPTVLAVLLEDGAAVLGVTLALLGIVLGQIFGSVMFDIVASLIISFLLAFMAIALGVINSKLLLGRSLTLIKEDEVKNFVADMPQIKRIEVFSTKILGAGSVRLSLEVELFAEKMIDRSALQNDVSDIENGKDKYKILVKASSRMVRTTGHEINIIESKIREKFPEINLIDIEVH